MENMFVNVQYLGLVRNKVKKNTEKLALRKGASVAELLARLASMYGESLKNLLEDEAENPLDPTFIVSVNGMAIDQLHGRATILYEGDTVALMTLISGG